MAESGLLVFDRQTGTMNIIIIYLALDYLTPSSFFASFGA